MTVQSVGNFAIFAGGVDWTVYPSSTISVADIYDSTTNSWSTYQMKQGNIMRSVVVGNYAIYGGGIFGGLLVDDYDMFDASSKSWTSGKLSRSQTRVAIRAGNLALFAGGRERDPSTGYYVPSPEVDVFDSQTNTWSLINLSYAPDLYISATVVGDLVLFAYVTSPGFTSVVDRWNYVTKSFLPKTALSTNKAWVQCATVGTTAIFHDGFTYDDSNPGAYVDSSRSRVVDVYHSTTGTWSSITVGFVPNYPAIVAGNSAILSGANGTFNVFGVSIYNSESDTWSSAPSTVSDKWSNYLVPVSYQHLAIMPGGRNGDFINFIYNSKTDSWTTFTLSQDRVEVTPAVVGDKVVIAGGHSGDVNVLSNVIEVYDFNGCTCISDFTGCYAASTTSIIGTTGIPAINSSIQTSGRSSSTTASGQTASSITSGSETSTQISSTTSSASSGTSATSGGKSQ